MDITTVTPAVSIAMPALIRFCQRHPIKQLALFGSVLRADFHADSDIDVLVEFLPNVVIGWNIVTMADELSTLLGRPVDLRTPAELSRHIRQQVLSEAWVIYESTG
jgi:predicted nucleotidyltransferase